MIVQKHSGRYYFQPLVRRISRTSYDGYLVLYSCIYTLYIYKNGEPSNLKTVETDNTYTAERTLFSTSTNACSVTHTNSHSSKSSAAHVTLAAPCRALHTRYTCDNITQLFVRARVNIPSSLRKNISQPYVRIVRSRTFSSRLSVLRITRREYNSSQT